jgi:hypothetical protein
LRAENARNLPGKTGTVEQGGVQNHLFNPKLEDPCSLFVGADAASIRDWHEAFADDFSNQAVLRLSLFNGRGHIEENEFVRPFVVEDLHGDARIADISRCRELFRLVQEPALQQQHGDHSWTLAR